MLAHCSPFSEYSASDSVDELTSNFSSNSSNDSAAEAPIAAPASIPAYGARKDGSSSSSTDSQATTPRSLTPAAAQQLEQLLLELLPKPPVSTPLTPVLSLMMPVLQPNLSALPPQALLDALRLCNAVGAGHTPSAAWLQAWAAALHKQLPRLTSDTACWMLAEVLRLRLAQLPDGVLDDLFVGMLKDPSSCSGSSMAAVLVAVAAAELSASNSSSTSAGAGSSSSSSSFGSAASVMLASWRSGYYSGRGGSSGRNSPDVSGVSQLYPLALRCCIEELGQDDRLAQLQPAELAGVAAAAAALQLKLPGGWLDRCAGPVFLCYRPGGLRPPTMCAEQLQPASQQHYAAWHASSLLSASWPLRPPVRSLTKPGVQSIQP